jgi:hypothetical protein
MRSSWMFDKTTKGIVVLDVLTKQLKAIVEL